ncbi:MAG: hypothetical protein EOM04_09350 [Clostridia bacterium]|jgi:hypothetical protein|nr:hypothetical protein [Clostridia bacterium]
MTSIKEELINIQSEKKQFITVYLLTLAVAFFFPNTWVLTTAMLIFFIYDANKVLNMGCGSKFLFYFLSIFPFLNIIPFFAIMLRFSNKESRLESQLEEM